MTTLDTPDPSADGLAAALPELSRAQASLNATIMVVGTTVVWASPMAVALIRATNESQVVGREVFEFVAPRSLGTAQSRNQNVRAGSAPRPEQISLLTVDGLEVLADIASMPVRWEGALASQVTLWPVETAADGSAETTESDRDITDSVIVTDASFRVLSFNQAAERLYGWTESEILGVSVTEAIPMAGDERDDRVKLQSLADNGRWHGQTLQKRRDGTVMPLFTSATLLRDADGLRLGAIFVNRPLGSDRSLADWPLIEQIRRGIERDEFVVYYQPIVRLETGVVVGVEALVRWQHPELGLLPPAAFIGTAEQSGLIVELGDIVLGAACEQAQCWREAGHSLQISVNLAGRQLVDAALPERLAALMCRTGIGDGQLWLEITETSVVHDVDLASACLHRLRELGARTSIDDFGTGWNSLHSLHTFPVDELKIDRSFVAGLGVRASDSAIINSIVTLGRELGASVVAEGIETEAQRQTLLQLGCTIGQGFLFSRPVPAEQLDLG